MRKQCMICLDEFFTDSVNAHSRKYCYNCVPRFNNIGDRTVAKRRSVKKIAIENLGGSCLKCSETRESCLDFHHVISSDKEHSMSSLLSNSRIEDFMNELQKCILLCSNCHRDFHYTYSNLTNEEDILHYLGVESISYWNNPVALRSESIEVYKEPSIKRVETEDELETEILTKGRETAEKLLKQVRETSFEAVGRLHGVSGNAIKKRLQRAGLPYLMSEIRPSTITEEIPKKQNWRDLPIILTNKGLEYSFETGYDAINYIVKNNDRTYSQASEGLGRVISGKRLTYLGYKIGGII